MEKIGGIKTVSYTHLDVYKRQLYTSGGVGVREAIGTDKTFSSKYGGNGCPEMCLRDSIMPTGEDADGNVLYLPELYIDSPNIGAFPHPKWIHPVSYTHLEVYKRQSSPSRGCA